MDLSTLSNIHGTSMDRLGYTQLYSTLLSHLRSEKLTLLEIGATAETLNLWASYFPAATIVGISDTFIALPENDRIRIAQCAPNSEDSVKEFFRINGILNYDIIIDHGQPNCMDVLSTIRNFYNHLTPGGLYIIEGINRDHDLYKYPTMIGCMCEHDSYFFAGQNNVMCVINKVYLQSKRESY